MKKLALPFLLSAALPATLMARQPENVKAPNVLFIAVDDLRPELGCYGVGHIHSPNIDRLSQSGIIFTRAYCNIPVCGASRASLMAGLRPNRNRFVNYNCYLDNDVPGVVSLPMHFRNNGYTTVSLGKVFHHDDDGKGSWHINYRETASNATSWLDYQTEENISLHLSQSKRGLPYEKANVDDDAYFDGKIANRAIAELQKFSESKEPFFMAVGFLKPHLPFNAPARYWDLYDRSKIQLPENPYAPKGAPVQAMHNFGELRAYHGIPAQGAVPDSMALTMIHGYFACVSYTDAQIGKLLDALKTLGLDKNTIVVLWGDHGWHLGEHGLWCKHCNFEKVLRIPLIISSPGKPGGVVSDALVETVDIYPTLCELSGLKQPFHLQGESLLPLIEKKQVAWKEEIFCRWITGETIITPTHAYTEWFDDKTGGFLARMLYNHQNDPDENRNIAEIPDYGLMVRELSRKLNKHKENRDRIFIP